MSVESGNVEGSCIGRYRIEGLVGSGGMGAVYRAFDPFLRRVVAVKALAGPRDDENAQERFFREARAIARLEHRNIVRIYEADAPQGIPYIAMEYLDGQDGREFVRSNPPLSRALEVMVQVFEGLACAHGLGVIHRDVKPGNIIILPGDVVKLIDFGLARLVDDQRDLTRGQVFGSAPFMAPEQITSPGQIDERTDVYSASVILYNLVTGCLPFTGATAAETLSQIVNAPAPDIESLRPGCPPAVAAFVRRCMSKDREGRPSSALEAAAMLRAILDRISQPSIALSPSDPLLPDFPPLPELTLSGPPQTNIREAAGPGPDEPTDCDLTGSTELAPATPLAVPNRPGPSSLRYIVLTVAATGLVLSIAAGAILWLRRPAPLSPPVTDDKTALIPPSLAQGSEPRGASAAGGPRLVVEEPTPHKLRIHVLSGEKLSFRVRVEDHGLQTGEPQWRLNDELTAVGSAWTYTAGSSSRVDLVSVAIPGVEVTPRTVVLWYVNVK